MKFNPLEHYILKIPEYKPHQGENITLPILDAFELDSYIETQYEAVACHVQNAIEIDEYMVRSEVRYCRKILKKYCIYIELKLILYINTILLKFKVYYPIT